MCAGGWRFCRPYVTGSVLLDRTRRWKPRAIFRRPSGAEFAEGLRKVGILKLKSPTLSQNPRQRMGQPPKTLRPGTSGPPDSRGRLSLQDFADD